MDGGGGGPIRGALARLRSAPLWVWLTILLTFGLLIFAYLQWRKSSSSGTSGTSSAAGTVPADGSGQPLWSSADTSGMMTGNMTDLAALLAYLQSQQTPNPPPSSTPNPPSGSTNPRTDSSGRVYFTITQHYSPATAGTTTIAGLAHRFHTTVANLLRLNPQVNPKTMTTYVGEEIRIR